MDEGQHLKVKVNEEAENEQVIHYATTPQSNSLRKFASALSIKTPTNDVMLSTQLGILYSLGKLSSVPERDLLMEDFLRINIYFFPSSGSSSGTTPAHRYGDFRFKDFAPVAFRYFRKVFRIQTDDFKLSLCDKPMKELSSSGASGSLFFKTNDDLYVLKTVDQREARFLQCILPGYYMNLIQNHSTLLPKFFGLYLYSSLANHFRFIIMNNLLPSNLKLDETYDIKGSTYKRKALGKELQKTFPTYKDLDFLNRHPKGLILEPHYRNVLISTLERDARVLASFKIMDYSLLIGIHNITTHNQAECPCGVLNVKNLKFNSYKRNEDLSYELRGLATRSICENNLNYQGGIPAKDGRENDLLLFIGIIDILQNYRLTKKIEHRFKSMVHDGKTISVNNPIYYQQRFLDFCKNKVFPMPENTSIVINESANDSQVDGFLPQNLSDNQNCVGYTKGHTHEVSELSAAVDQLGLKVEPNNLLSMNGGESQNEILTD